MKRYTIVTSGTPRLSMKHQTSAMPTGNATGTSAGAAMKYGTGMTGPASGNIYLIIVHKLLDI